ncbi:MAG: sulfite exporter TauE/SafE family protein [Mariprofundaceae bacterium]|nr:sulfite exporter TauE/SafE family protein [Mariprofundaceae bacterium]
MLAEWVSLLAYGLCIGLIAGFIGGSLSGLAGLGGGLIYVPIFYFLMPSQEEAMSLPIMMSMIAVCMTAFFSSLAHWRLGHIRPPSYLLTCLVMGAVFGLWMTLHWPAWFILLAMAILNIWVGLDMGRQKEIIQKNISAWWGLPIGLISGSLGIGAGTMMVPLLRRAMPLRFAVGTAIFCGAVMSCIAIIINLSVDHTWLALLKPQLPFIIGLLNAMIIVLPRSTAWASQLHQNYAEERIRLMLQFLFFILATMLCFSAMYRYFN